jgi:peroxiredoxin
MGILNLLHQFSFIKENFILTILFDESDRQSPAPAFSLQSKGEDLIAQSDYYERNNLVLIFSPEDISPQEQISIDSILKQQTRIETENARVLTLHPQPIGNLTAEQSPTIPILEDVDGTTRAKYAGLVAPDLIRQQDVMIYVLDTFGAPYVCLVGEQVDESIVNEILSWLLYMNIQCPE